MYEYAKYEFNRWLSKLDTNKLDPYQKRLIGLLIKHFDKIAAVGTAGGRRAKLLGDYIKKMDVSSDENVVLKMQSRVSSRRVKRLSSMKVENFRGFGTEVEFNFNKQYTLFQGTNGSGKTSFCEALEYSMLGTIEEASARNIPVGKYILHAGQKKAVYPNLVCMFTDGKNRKCIPDLAAYRFAFIEKNRIEKFSHIGATTARNQTERIAALFGLSEFQDYVSGFTGVLDDRYIKLKSDIQESYKKKQESAEIKKEQLKAVREQIEPTRKNLEEAIRSINATDIKDAESAKEYLTDSETGLIPIAAKKAAEYKKPLIDGKVIEKLQQEISLFLVSKSAISENASIILGNVESANLLDLYKSLIELRTSWKEGTCPACHTPLDRVRDNPFEFAQSAVSSFTKIEEAKKMISEEAKRSVESFRRIKDLLQDLPRQSIFPGVEFSEIDKTDISEENFELLDADAIKVYESIMQLRDLLSREDTVEKIRSYNENARIMNERYDIELRKLQELLANITEKSAAVTAVEDTIKILADSLVQEENELKELKKAAEKEETVIAFNAKMAEAYESFVRDISIYANHLPLELAGDLAERTVRYYNKMNCDDAEFELLKKVKLPVSPNDKIIITMFDGTEQDAMLLLSEGHVKLLGLSILLAKAVQMKMPFLIFDDIVNAIDDDHRDGVAKLLIEDPDFKDTQMILTCHGEIFVSKLEDLVTQGNAVERYMFLPADSLNERGIVIRYRDPSVPLKTARAKFEEGSLKDCAAQCRRAIECITVSLWGKMASHIPGGISVQLINLKLTPDLYHVTAALAKASTPKYILGMESVHADLSKLLENRMWMLLNKGTHYDDAIPEFTRTEVRELLKLVEHLAEETKSLKIKPGVNGQPSRDTEGAD